MHSYSLGNCLRGYCHGEFASDEEAWNALTAEFNRAYPSKGGRDVEFSKTLRVSISNKSYEDSLGDARFYSGRAPTQKIFWSS